MTIISDIYEGLPHCHLVLQLTDVANIDDQEAIARFIDRYITAEAPVPEPTSMHPDDIQDHEIYRKLVGTCMLHRCYPQSEGGCVGENGFCKRGYETSRMVQETHFDEKGFPVYRRRQPADCRVIPHNRQMLIDWGGHVNMEYSGSVYTASKHLSRIKQYLTIIAHRSYTYTNISSRVGRRLSFLSQTLTMSLITTR